MKPSSEQALSLAKKYVKTAVLNIDPVYPFDFSAFELREIKSNDDNISYVVTSMKDDALNFHFIPLTRIGRTEEEAIKKWIKWILNEDISIPEIQLKLAIAGIF